MLNGSNRICVASAILFFLAPSLFTSNDRVMLNDYERNAFLAASYGADEETIAEFLAAEGCAERVRARLAELKVRIQYADDRNREDRAPFSS
jgi:hypothetical protein